MKTKKIKITLSISSVTNGLNEKHYVVFQHGNIFKWNRHPIADWPYNSDKERCLDMGDSSHHNAYHFETMSDAIKGIDEYIERYKHQLLKRNITVKLVKTINREFIIEV